jgi:hypothetical protein
LKEAKKVVGVVLIANDQASEASQVSEEPPNLPATFVTPQLPAILRLGLFAVPSVRHNQLDALYGKLGVR